MPIDRRSVQTVVTATHEFAVRFPEGSAADREFDDVSIVVCNHTKVGEARRLVWPFLRAVALHLSDADFAEIVEARRHVDAQIAGFHSR